MRQNMLSDAKFDENLRPGTGISEAYVMSCAFGRTKGGPRTVLERSFV